MMFILRLLIHYGLHFLAPLGIAKIFYKEHWQRAYLILLVTMLIDLDHLLANPIFDPNRCSINFHSLHTYYALAIYIALLGFKKTRLIGVGLCLHFLTDALDCLWI